MKPLDSTARANFLWNHIKANVRRRFKKLTDVFVRERGRLFALDIKGVALIRFKKVDGKFRTRNVPTRQQLELQMQIQTENAPLPGFPDEATWLTCGYLLDEFETTIEKYVITCFVGSERRYVIPFGDGADATETLDTPVRQAPPGRAKVYPISVPQEIKQTKPRTG